MWDNIPRVSIPVYGKRAVDLRFADEEQGLERSECRTATIVYRVEEASLRNLASSSGLDDEHRQIVPQLICRSTYLLQHRSPSSMS